MNLKDFIKGVEAELTKPESIAEEFQQITGMEHLDRLRQQALDQARREGRIEGLREALKIVRAIPSKIRMSNMSGDTVDYIGALEMVKRLIDGRINQEERADARHDGKLEATMDKEVKEIQALRDQLNSTIEQRDSYFKQSQNWEGKYKRQSKVSFILLAIIFVTNLAWILR